MISSKLEQYTVKNNNNNNTFTHQKNVYETDNRQAKTG